MRRFFIFSLVVIWSLSGNAELQAETLAEESLYNNKVFTVSHFKQDSGIKVRVVSRYVGEPAKWPQVLYPYIQCPGTKGYKPIDIARRLLARAAEEFAPMIGAPTKTFKSGVLHVCAIDNVNFDSSNLFITIFEAGSDSCDRSKVMDLMFDIKEICKK